jgi:hypothetical protein
MDSLYYALKDSLNNSAPNNWYVQKSLKRLVYWKLMP